MTSAMQYLEQAPPWSQMPHALRGDTSEAIIGLPQPDLQKVAAANLMLYGAYKVIKGCLRLNIAGYLEKPLVLGCGNLP